MRFLRLFIGALICALPASAWPLPPQGAYLDGGKSAIGVILVHGRYRGRGSAESEVVNPLRIALHDRLDVHTVSLEYPQTEGSRDAEDEAANFPAAFERIAAAAEFLTREQGVTRIYLMGHSLGARITIAYLATHTMPGLRGYIGIGIRGGGCEGDAFDPLATFCNLKTVLRNDLALPILDMVAAADAKEVRFADLRQRLLSPTYRQIRIEGADHNFRRAESVMVDDVTAWVKQQAGL